jgi:hypothetical protein
MSSQLGVHMLDPRSKRDKDVMPPEVKAKQLLSEILPKDAWRELSGKGYFHHQGKVGIYKICRESQTEIYRNGRLLATSCLQLTIFAPSYDRMAAEYLILNNDEQLYWTNANIFPVRRAIGFRVLAIGILDLGLFLMLVFNYWR